MVRLSYEHKVSAIAVDGLEASKYDPYKGLCFDGLSNLNEKQTEELKAVLVPWIKDVENTEWSYCYYVEVLMTLCEIFRENGLTPIILKGYGLSLNYLTGNNKYNNCTFTPRYAACAFATYTETETFINNTYYVYQ